MLFQECNVKKFTYDFNGDIIYINPVKTEKLPPHSYTMKFYLILFVQLIKTVSESAIQ